MVKGQVRSATLALYNSFFPIPSNPKDISFIVDRACSTRDKIVVRCALTIYPYSLDLDLSGGALIKACFVGLSNRFCTGTAYRRERKFTNFIVSSLKDWSFKECDCGKLFICQEKNAPHSWFLMIILTCNFLSGHDWFSLKGQNCRELN